MPGDFTCGEKLYIFQNIFPIKPVKVRSGKTIQCCPMSQEPPRNYDFVKESSKRGPIRWTGLIVTVIVGGAAVYYVKQAKDEMEKSTLPMYMFL
jgi:hypothetical protein